MSTVLVGGSGGELTGHPDSHNWVSESYKHWLSTKW